MHGILFLCVANSARSQMAEGLARHLAGDGLRVQSAGSLATHVHPMAIAVLAELGIDSSKQYSKSVNDIDPATVDTVVTLCAEEECPLFLGKAARLHWEQPDPGGGRNSEEIRAGFRKIRDSIRTQILAWMKENDIPMAAG